MTRPLGPHELYALRQVPLPAVLRASGARPDRYDRKKWHTAQGIISITGMKFMNWSQNVGGGGAIDLVMHLHQLDFRAAVQWLGHRPSIPRLHEHQGSAQVLSLPSPDHTQLPAVQRYLTAHRALPPALIQWVIESGELYADRRANAVFLLRGKENQPVGAELRGTGAVRWRGLAPGSRKDLGYFRWRPHAATTAIILCESAIDALSCLLLCPRCLAISTAGARANPRWLPDLLRESAPVYCGFDADLAGDAMAQQMAKLYPTVQRLRPALHDWNDVLKSDPHLTFRTDTR
jgi:Protein of unknown function (DUF3991)/Toprim-like